MSWNSFIKSENDRVQKYSVTRYGEPIAYCEVLALWRDDASFREFFNGVLVNSSFAAFRWETPSVTRASACRDFEFVLLRSDGLAGRVDSKAFTEHFKAAKGSDVVTFQNLGRDATLVVAAPIGDESTYGHLASFVRDAPNSQRHHLWQAVGEAMQKRLNDAPVWLSTAGYGVSWLHVRLDSRPKYYGYAPYKDIA
jgi:hypothetical protein